MILQRRLLMSSKSSHCAHNECSSIGNTYIHTYANINTPTHSHRHTMFLGKFLKHTFVGASFVCRLQFGLLLWLWLRLQLWVSLFCPSQLHCQVAFVVILAAAAAAVTAPAGVAATQCHICNSSGSGSSNVCAQFLRFLNNKCPQRTCL